MSISKHLELQHIQKSRHYTQLDSMYTLWLFWNVRSKCKVGEELLTTQQGTLVHEGI